MPQTQSFDYVVVGAGSAGCAVAATLSADGRHSVALIEAGGSDRRLWTQVPLGYGKTFYDRTLNWAYMAEPDPGIDGRADYWPRGKILGGSSAINAMVWIRGNPRDFDDWAAGGAVGWGWADVLPVFRAIEDNAAGPGPDALRGAGGPVHVSDIPAAPHPLARRFVQAGMQAGLAFNPDFNGAVQDGVGYYQANIAAGRRVCAARAFLRPAMRRANLAVLTRAHACRIAFDGGRATGVEIDRAGARSLVRARRDVILCAGAIGSPLLLQRSGIGPAGHLAAIGVAPLRDSPAVGAHLQDHLGINYTYRARVPSLNQRLRPWWGKTLAGLDYVFRRSGPLSLSLNQAGGFARTRAGLDRPNIQLYFQAITTTTAGKGERPLMTPDRFSGFSLGLSSCTPQARGAVMARSADPFAAPRITPNALGTEADLRDVLEGLRLLRRLAAQPALREAIAEELAPGPGVTTDAGLIADFRDRCGTVYHPVGTCRMGADPALSVVDARLRVRGVEGLRVIDASVFPAVICGNTNAAAIMTGVRGATLAQEDAR
jgi:choline dehydrogenase